MLDVLRFLLRSDPKPIEADDVVAWWRASAQVRAAFSRAVERAVVSGFASDRLGYAFAGGYEAALDALVGTGPDHIASFCATEAGGNHPRAIQASLARNAEGRLLLNGEKRWATLAPVATELFVVVSEGEDGGRKRMRLVRVSTASPGVRITAMPPTPFVPEVPHAEINFTDVPLSEADVLPGDGYTAYVKPFRTVEDVHVHAAALGYLVGVARRYDFPQSAVEALAATIVATCALAELDPSAPEGHVALAGALAESRKLLEKLADHWDRVDDKERERLHRDRVLLDVASGAREKRLQRAWEALTDGE